jgi:biotin carboxylase
VSDHVSNYFWVIGGGVLQLPLIEEAIKLDYEIVVTDGDVNCICKDKATYFEAIDIFDIDKHIRYAQKLVNKGVQIKGVLAAGIDAPETMAKVAEHLGLLTVSSEIAHLVNNKEVFRKKMKEIGMPVPEFQSVSMSNFNHLPNIIDEIGYPLIVKNTSSSGSRGTKIFYSPDLDAINMMVQEAINVSRSGNALIESLWEGSEHTVETLFDSSGRFRRCFITDRIFDKSDGFALETGLVHPSRLPSDEQEEMYLVAEKVSKELGINIGAAKFDMMQTKDGPRVIEMTVRLSGGFDCQYLVPSATGKNVLKAAILTATGEIFDDSLLVDTKQKVSLSESIWPLPGKITKIGGIETAKGLTGFEYIYFRYNVGDTVMPYTDCTKRVCFIIASGKDYAEAAENMDDIKKTISITID